MLIEFVRVSLKPHTNKHHIMAKDFFKNELNEGDIVAFMLVKYRDFTLGTITKITDKMVIISHKHPTISDHYILTKQFHNQVIKKC